MFHQDVIGISYTGIMICLQLSTLREGREAMKLELLHEFVVLAKHRNFSTAAKELYSTQPGLSSHMAALEKELGFSLLDRSSGKLGLTPAGLEFLKRSQLILDAWDKTLERCSELADAQAPVRIASVSPRSALYNLIVDQMDVPVTFVDVDYNTPIPLVLARGLADVAVYDDCRGLSSWEKDLEEKGLSYIPCSRYRLAICFMKTHPLAAVEHLSAEDVARYPIRINSGAYFDTHKYVLAKNFPAGVEPSFMLDPLENSTGLYFVDFEDGVHICGLDAIRDSVDNRNDVVMRTEIDGLDMAVDSGLLYRNDAKGTYIEGFVKKLAALMMEQREKEEF